MKLKNLAARLRVAERTAERAASVLFCSRFSGDSDREFLRAISSDSSPLTLLLKSGENSEEAFRKISEGQYRLFFAEEDYSGGFPDWFSDRKAGYRFPVKWSSLVRWESNRRYDCKVPWELSRMQFIPSLVGYSVSSGTKDGLVQAEKILNNWISENPWNRGINWVSAMEIALRGLNLLVYSAYAYREGLADLKKLSEVIWKHIHSINALELARPGNLRHNHILVSSALQILLCCSVRSRVTDSYLKGACCILEEEILHQFRPDGGHFESSMNYHRFCLEAVLILFLVLKNVPSETLHPSAFSLIENSDILARLSNALQITEICMDTMGIIPSIGDSDDGRVFFYRDYFSWQPSDHRYLKEMAEQIPDLPEPSYRLSCTAPLFPHSGLGFYQGEKYGLCCCSTPVDIIAGGHAHSDKCSFLLQVRGHQVLTDPGTGCYTPDLKRRTVLRSAGSHNVFLIDGKDFMNYAPNRAFGPVGRIETQIASAQEQNSSISFLMSHTGYSRYESLGTVKRKILCSEQELLIEDSAEGNGTREYSIHYTFAPEITVERKEKCLAVSGGSRVLCLIRFPENADVSIGETLYSSAYGVFATTLHAVVKGKVTLPGIVRHSFIF
ncbi:hypothetical protein CSA37_07560 [Candidatus Fermentibacteria bacterium]|nr:MAG: hypothetical protein CSA37_07560 [Candidatus Fermentibacteria bacterium]